MQINTPSAQEIAVTEPREPEGSLRCPVCSGSLVPLHNTYRCSRCGYHLCVGCEPFDLGPPERD